MYVLLYRKEPVHIEPFVGKLETTLGHLGRAIPPMCFRRETVDQ